MEQTPLYNQQDPGMLIQEDLECVDDIMAPTIGRILPNGSLYILHLVHSVGLRYELHLISRS